MSQLFLLNLMTIENTERPVYLYRMNWKELLTTYGTITGSIATLILLGIGYLIRRHYDLKSKKIELNYSFFQEKKLSAINRFFDKYTPTERMWHHFPIYKLLNKTLNETQIDEMVWPLQNALNSSLLELNIYLNEEEMEPFKIINDNIYEMYNFILKIYTDEFSDVKKVHIGNEFATIQRKALRECDRLLKKIGKNIRGEFYKKH